MKTYYTGTTKYVKPKVFCKNCIYLVALDNPYCSPYCNYSEFKEDKNATQASGFRIGKRTLLRDYANYNKKNDCRHFKPNKKWWQFSWE